MDLYFCLQVYRPSVHYYTKMLFLKDQVEPRRGFSNWCPDPLVDEHSEPFQNAAVATVSTIGEEGEHIVDDLGMSTGGERQPCPSFYILPSAPDGLNELPESNRSTPNSPVSPGSPVPPPAPQAKGSSSWKKVVKKKTNHPPAWKA